MPRTRIPNSFVHLESFLRFRDSVDQSPGIIVHMDDARHRCFDIGNSGQTNISTLGDQVLDGKTLAKNEALY